MLSITSEYALRALVALAESGVGMTMQAKGLAGATKVPSSYLYKILTTLRRAGILGGTRGTHGGYSLSRPAEGIMLIDVVSLFEEVKATDACVLGRSDGCSDETPCGAHDDWRRLMTVYDQFLRSTSIADLVVGQIPEAVQDGRSG